MHAIVLDKTIFHPQGGGQPNDEGVIRHSDNDMWFFKVAHLVEKQGAIWHVGSFEPAECKEHYTKDCQVTCEVNDPPRLLYARIHSAGHLVDMAMRRAGRLDLKPSKGYHFPTGAYVEYAGEVAPADRDPLCKALTEHANAII